MAVDERPSVDERLNRLERSVGFWKKGTWLLSLVLAGVLGSQLLQLFKVPAVVRARQFEVVDAQGRPLISLEQTEGGGLIRTSNPDGQPLFLVMADSQGKGTVTTSNGKGQEMVYIGSTTTGGAIALLNNMGHDVVNLQSSKSNCGLVLAKDYDGKAQESLTGKRRL